MAVLMGSCTKGALLLRSWARRPADAEKFWSQKHYDKHVSAADWHAPDSQAWAQPEPRAASKCVSHSCMIIQHYDAFSAAAHWQRLWKGSGHLMT